MVLIFLDKCFEEAKIKAKEIVLDESLETVIRNDALLSIYDIYKEYSDPSRLSELNAFLDEIKDLYNSPQAIYYNNLDLGIYYKLGLDFFNENLEELRYYSIYMDSLLEFSENLYLSGYFSVASIYLSALIPKVDDSSKASIYNDYLESLSLSGKTKEAINILDINTEFNKEYLKDEEEVLIRINILYESYLHSNLYEMQSLFESLDDINTEDLAKYINSFVKVSDYRASNMLVEQYLDVFYDESSFLKEKSIEAFAIYFKDKLREKKPEKEIDSIEVNLSRKILLETELFGFKKAKDYSKIFLKNNDYNISDYLFKLKSYIYGTFTKKDYSKAKELLNLMKKTGQSKDIIMLYTDILNNFIEKSSSQFFSRYYSVFSQSSFSLLDDISLSYYLKELYRENKEEAVKAAKTIFNIYKENKREIIGDNITSILLYILLETEPHSSLKKVLLASRKKTCFSKANYFAVILLFNKGNKKEFKKSQKNFKKALESSSTVVIDYYKDGNFDKFPLILDF